MTSLAKRHTTCSFILRHRSAVLWHLVLRLIRALPSRLQRGAQRLANLKEFHGFGGSKGRVSCTSIGHVLVGSHLCLKMTSILMANPMFQSQQPKTSRSQTHHLISPPCRSGTARWRGTGKPLSGARKLPASCAASRRGEVGKEQVSESVALPS